MRNARGLVVILAGLVWACDGGGGGTGGGGTSQPATDAAPVPERDAAVLGDAVVAEPDGNTPGPDAATPDATRPEPDGAGPEADAERPEADTAVSPSCGDGECNGGETCGECPADCGTCCGDGLCRVDQGEDCNSCRSDCGCADDEVCGAQGRCVVQCQPTCDGRTCGPNGCGGNCGDCEGDQICNAAGACVAIPANCGDRACGEGEDCATCPADCGACCGDDACTPNHGEDCGTCPVDCGCPAGDVCDLDAHDCVQGCLPACDGRVCGDDGCGGSCGRCGAGEICDDTGACVAACVRDCNGRTCGPDNCGGSCGQCAPGTICNAAGACVADCAPDCNGRNCGDDACSGSCGECGPNDHCSPNGVCVPDCVADCDGRECGDDGCGGTCGDCAGGEFCRPEGVCGALCVPNCQDRECGSNNCGGTCGDCAADQVCDARGRCLDVCQPQCDGLECGDDGCGGSCGDCGAGSHCGAAGQCVPDCVPQCDGLQCGDDGCGGVCGACNPGDVCNAGHCRPPVVFCDCVGNEECVDGFCRAPDELCSPENPVGICAGGRDCLAGECEDRGAACSAQNATGVCPLGEVCRNGTCEPFDAARLCDDANPCTLDRFDYVRNRCAHDPQMAECEDGNGCTDDLCDDGVCRSSPIGGCIEPPVLDPYRSPTNQNGVTLAGTKPAGAAIYINGEQAVAENPDVRWSVILNLVPGENIYEVHSRDRGQDSASVTARIVYDVTAPTLTITPAGGIFLNPVTVTVTADEPATVYYTDDGGTPDEWSRRFTSVKQIRVFDDTVLRFRARDVAGNWMPQDVRANFTITGHGNGWREGPMLPEPRTLAAAAIHDGKLVVLGGTDGLAPQAGVYRYDFATGMWDNPPQLNMPRTRAAALTVGNALYIVGGDTDGAPLNALQRWRTGDAAWANLAPMPSTRFGIAAVHANNRIYVFGGQGNGGAVLTNVEYYDIGANNWSNQVAQMPRARYGHSAVDVAGLVYLIGGETEDGTPIAEVDVYDPAQNRWSLAPNLPTPRSFATVTKNYNVGPVNGGHRGIVVAGGLTRGGLATAVVEELVIEDNAWRERTPLSAPRHSAASVTWERTEAGVMDGYEVRGLVIGGLETDAVEATTTYFTLAQDYRRTLSPMPEGRFLHGAEVVDGLVYLFGGRNFQETRAVWSFDPETERYEELPDLPGIQNGLGSAVFDGQVYAIGGANGFGTAIANLRRYDPDARAWTDMRAMPTSRKDPAVVVVGDDLWVIGGDNNGPVQTVEIYTPATNQWRAGTALPTGRAGARAVQRDGVVYVIGGIAPNGQPATEVLRYNNNAWQVAFSGLPVAYAAVALVGDNQLNVFGGRTAAGPSNVIYSVVLPGGAQPRDIAAGTNLLAPYDRAAMVALNGDLYVFGGNASVNPGPAGEPLVQKVWGQCFDGLLNGREVASQLVANDSGGGCLTRRGCTGTLYGDVCVTNLSANCQGGSAVAYCNGFETSRVITHAEFLRIINNGWVRPNSNYHTLSVDQIAACGGGPGAVEIPGFGDPNRLWSNQCGDNLNYCSRAIMCVLR